MKIYIDPGHGGSDPGAIGNGLQEKDIVLPISLKIGEILKKHNVEVVYSRTTDVYMSLEDRVIKANQANVDIFVSVHINAYSNPAANGIETFSYPGSTKNSDKLAEAIQNELVNARLFKSNRGTKTENFYVLRETKMTAALTELGFITNSDDVQVLKTKEKEIAEAVARGILTYIGIKYTNGMPILSKPTVFFAQMKEWAKKKNAHQTFINLAPTFYAISNNAGINPAVTYAQSAKETGYMKFGGVLDISFNNPCGMKKTSGGGDGDPGAHQRFLNWEEGIQAQVDHLALYAGASGYPKQNTPDPRHFPYLHGTAPMVEDLGGKWAPSNQYGEDIVKMVREIENIVVEETEKLDILRISLHGRTSETEGIHKNNNDYIPVGFLGRLGYNVNRQNDTIIIEYKTGGQS